MIKKKGTLSPRAYARLYAMIGEQLIRNEKIALIELIKNSYDADATWVQVRFKNFKKIGDDIKLGKKSVIEIEDNGIGMNFDIIKDAWMNPASPHKYLKRQKGKNKTKKGRILQGEKGIGRFSAFKLGKKVEMTTREKKKGSEEIKLISDISEYDDELLKKSKKSKRIYYLDELEFQYEIKNKPELMIKREMKIQGESLTRSEYGTNIRISFLKGNWDLEKIDGIFNDCLKLTSPFERIEFKIDILVNGELLFSSKNQERFEDLLDNAPLIMRGHYYKNQSIEYYLNNERNSMTIEDMKENKDIKKYFFNKKAELKRNPECGPFTFKYYIYDLSRKSHMATAIDEEDIKLIKSHRIYLYRDGMRVYPYGDPSDDWLGIDILRGTYKAGDYLSNDQVIGMIGITKEDNKQLRDITNREGLMEIGNAFNDLKIINIGILGFLHKELKKKKAKKKKSREKKYKKKGLFIKDKRVDKGIKKIMSHLSNKKDNKGKEIVENIKDDYKYELGILTKRAEIVEELAAVGMTVDAASHDMMIMMGRVSESINKLIKLMKMKYVDRAKLTRSIQLLSTQHHFIEDQMHGIQPLFRSTRRRTKEHDISEILKKVKKYYNVLIKRHNIVVDINNIDSKLKIKCPEAVLLQVFINLFDNSVYWLSITKRKNKQIKIKINGKTGEVTFSDNGKGVRKNDIPYIFDAFFSTKGISGRGLGLYIARQLLERYDFEIEYIEKDKQKVLSGANFLINFSVDEEMSRG